MLFGFAQALGVVMMRFAYPAFAGWLVGDAVDASDGHGKKCKLASRRDTSRGRIAHTSPQVDLKAEFSESVCIMFELGMFLTVLKPPSSLFNSIVGELLKFVGRRSRRELSSAAPSRWGHTSLASRLLILLSTAPRKLGFRNGALCATPTVTDLNSGVSLHR